MVLIIFQKSVGAGALVAPFHSTDPSPFLDHFIRSCNSELIISYKKNLNTHYHYRKNSKNSKSNSSLSFLPAHALKFHTSVFLNAYNSNFNSNDTQ